MAAAEIEPCSRTADSRSINALRSKAGRGSLGPRE
ncbi:Uncharacterised protein [Bordetella pertussis]|nr:Uncharacterised protein [Bordetella pertussis]